MKRITMQDLKSIFGKARIKEDDVACRLPDATEARPDERPRKALNKTEAEWERMMRVERPSSIVVAQPCRFFHLDGGGTYTPDFLEVRGELPIVVWEVKGGYHGPGYEQGHERFKRAAAQWSDGVHFVFMMAMKRKGRWTTYRWMEAPMG